MLVPSMLKDRVKCYLVHFESHMSVPCNRFLFTKTALFFAQFCKFGTWFPWGYISGQAYFLPSSRAWYKFSVTRERLRF